MKIVKFIRRNLLFVISSVFFLIWMVFLITTSVNASPSYSFIDAWTQEDVTNQYSYEISAERYILEPFSGLNFIIVNGLTDVLIIVVIGYVIIRVLYLLFSRFIYLLAYPSSTGRKKRRKGSSSPFRQAVVCLLS